MGLLQLGQLISIPFSFSEGRIRCIIKLNGLSKGKILYGYGHEESYWYDRNNISAEGWAQFGRIQFVNNTMVMQMLTELFPSFTKDAILALKGG